MNYVYPKGDAFWDIIWRHGGPRLIWRQNERLIWQIINKFNLKPMDTQKLMGLKTISRTQAKELVNKNMVVKIPPFPGGIKAAHLHYKGNIFELNKKQWADFSSKIIAEFQTKLSKVRTISFEKAIEISEVMGNLK